MDDRVPVIVAVLLRVSVALLESLGVAETLRVAERLSVRDWLHVDVSEADLDAESEAVADGLWL